MASSTTFLFLFVAILSFLSLSYSVQGETVRNAAEILSNSGYISMSLTLLLIHRSLLRNASTATIFSPSDEAFFHSGQPSLSLIELHIAPFAYSFDELQSLPYGSRIPTLSPNLSLIVTTLPSDDRISINDVRIDGSPIYDDGILIGYAIDEFFDLDFRPALSPSLELAPRSPVSSPNFECPVFSGGCLFAQAGESLRSNGFSTMASFLDLQLVQFDDDDTQFTVFAPIDEALQVRLGELKGWGALFLQHGLPCEVSLSDLTDLEDGAVLSTFLEGFWINVTRSGDLVLVNGVPVVFPEVYHGDRLMVHGIQEVLAMPGDSEAAVASSPSGDRDEISIPEF